MGEDYADAALLALLLFLAFGVSHSACLLLRFWRYELSSGPLRVKEYYSPSITGAEGMMGLKARVIDVRQATAGRAPLLVRTTVYLPVPCLFATVSDHYR